MMSRIALSFGGLVGLAAAVAAPLGAAAQCRLCANPTTVATQDESAKPIELEIQSTLDFGRLILLGTSGATATLRPDGSSSVSGGLSGLSGRSMVGSAVVRGEPGRVVRVELPNRIELHSIAGGRIAIHEVITDLPALPRLDSTGKLSFRFGGQLELSGEADGDYRGDLQITVDYL